MRRLTHRFRRIREIDQQIEFSTALPKLVAVVTCKGRLAHLRLTLPDLLQQLSDAEKVVVVDYGDPDGVFEYCMSLANPHIVGARILENTDIFNLSHARNCGANVLNSDVLLFFDADSVLRPGFISHAVGLIRIGRAVLTRRDLRDGRADTCGLCCVRTDIFHEAHGYDEQFQGWGPEDSDFYSRVRRLGIVHTFPGRLYPATLKHSDADRTRFYHCKDRSESARRSGALMGNPLRVVNPAGYGRAKARICSVLNEPACEERNLCEPQA